MMQPQLLTGQKQPKTSASYMSQLHVKAICHREIKNTFFLLAAAWVDPGRSALQSAEQRCQRRYVESTDLVECQFMTKTCKKAIIWKTKYYAQKEKKEGNHPQLSDRIAEEGSGEVIQTAPTPEQQRKRHR